MRGGAVSWPWTPEAERAPTKAVPPEGKVELVPLDGDRTSSTSSAMPAPGSAAASGSVSGATPPGSAAGSAADPSGAPSAGGTGAGTGGSSGGTGGGSASGGTGSGGSSGGGTAPTAPGATPPAKPAEPAGPAVLTLGAPVRAAADKRWCEQVTVEFRNTGGSPVRSGTVTFGTHIIGALGVDWATVESAQPLPAPIAAGARTTKTYTVCVDAWRVPLGMHIETQDVSADWR
ncbi:hypothetical protein NLX86_07720 [Streptomyces sp. A3M-1-3]|uniref:hypothetical protein n=1 Tax=Streptomyces sp. A3M-1-3 TaxID=2962044 RepID=UPI0020B6CBB1|nr:hypothetical protein [Streptomyces sp. A3M-1-3]MCP3818012.1 hypothetical protein [Streptomyces sp. A3M-1-3]